MCNTASVGHRPGPIASPCWLPQPLRMLLRTAAVALDCSLGPAQRHTSCVWVGQLVRCDTRMFRSNSAAVLVPPPAARHSSTLSSVGHRAWTRTVAFSLKMDGRLEHKAPK